jgi:hypothetical protein
LSEWCAEKEVADNFVRRAHNGNYHPNTSRNPYEQHRKTRPGESRRHRCAQFHPVGYALGPYRYIAPPTPSRSAFSGPFFNQSNLNQLLKSLTIYQLSNSLDSFAKNQRETADTTSQS